VPPDDCRFTQFRDAQVLLEGLVGTERSLDFARDACAATPEADGLLGDYLEFYIDDVRQSPRITGETDWALQSYTLTAGIHTLKWRFINGGGSSGQECGWVDFVQWTGPSPKQDPSKWQEITYKQDVTGRRVEKKVDGYSTRYVYDGGQVIAEYDGNPQDG
jgi:hypothetical protein